MTITTYYATRRPGHSDRETDAIIHLVNDLTAENGDNRSWDATRAHLDALTDADTQSRLGITIEAEQYELTTED
jgi:hypothetical protein